jgi:hypothetical protein
MENKAIFLDEYLNKLGETKFDSTDTFFTWKKGTFNVRLDAYLYRDKLITYYAYIYPTDEKLLIDIAPIEPISKESKDKDKIVSARILKIKERIEKGDLKLFVGENIIGQLARMAVMGLKNNWVLIIIIAVAVGIGAGGGAYTFGYNGGLATGFDNAQKLFNSTVISPLPSV